MDANGPPPEIPALLTTTSIRPHTSAAWATIASASPTTLWWSATASPPASVISRTTSSAGRSPLADPAVVTPGSFTSTRPPRAASSRAWAAPSPRPPPVTIATRPSKRRSAIGHLSDLRSPVSGLGSPVSRPLPSRPAVTLGFAHGEALPARRRDVRPRCAVRLLPGAAGLRPRLAPRPPRLPERLLGGHAPRGRAAGVAGLRHLPQRAQPVPHGRDGRDGRRAGLPGAADQPRRAGTRQDAQAHQPGVHPAPGRGSDRAHPVPHRLHPRGPRRSRLVRPGRGHRPVATAARDR